MGQKKCCVCEERSLDFPDRTFFKVPPQEKLKDKFIAWKKFIGEPYYTESVEIYICEFHFEDSYIIQGKSHKLLSVGVIPTIVTRNQEIATVLNRFVPGNSKPKQKLIFFSDIVGESQNLSCIHSNMMLKKIDKGILLIFLNSSQPFQSECQIFIDLDKKVSIYFGEQSADMIKFKEFFAKPYILSSLSELKNLTGSIVKKLKNEIHPIKESTCPFDALRDTYMLRFNKFF